MNEGIDGYPDVEEEIDRRELNERIEQNNLKTKPKRLNPIFANDTTEALKTIAAKGHKYHFVGRVGSFCPIKPGAGGGYLMCLRDGKYNSVAGAKGYRWLEAEMVQTTGKEKDIDMAYFTSLADEAKDAIMEYGDFEWFAS